jgi:putative ABC transport system permease protein
MARRYFPHEDPIGKLVQTTVVVGGAVGGPDVPSVEEKRPREIVGIVRNVRQFGASSEQEPTMYGSVRQHGSDYPGGFYVFHLWKSFTIRTAGDPRGLNKPLQKAIAEVDKDQALFNVETEDDALAEFVAFPRFQMKLFALFGGIGLLLAAVGIYGVTSYLVAQRSHEFGVRIALGATPAQVLRLVMLRGMRVILFGLFAGIAGALALSRLLSSSLYGVKNTDPVTYSLAALVLVMVALLACYVPARRATRVDPLVALRQE